MVSYEPLWETMKARGVTTYTLIEKHRIPSKTIYNLKHNKNITTATIENLCNILKCTPNDVFTFYTPAIDAGEEQAKMKAVDHSTALTIICDKNHLFISLW